MGAVKRTLTMLSAYDMLTRLPEFYVTGVFGSKGWGWGGPGAVGYF